MKNREEMLKVFDIMMDEEKSYQTRLDAYEYLMEDCEDILEEMIAKIYTVEGETGNMLMEILARYKGNKAIFMGLVSYLYKGEDVALYARLIGSYEDEQGVEVLKTFCENYEPNYNEYMEIRNAVEELGGDFDLKEDFSDDPLYRFLKGLDETDDDSRRSPFEDYFSEHHAKDDDDEDYDDYDADYRDFADYDEEGVDYDDEEDDDHHCHCHDDDCHCHDDDCDDECHCHNNESHCHHHN